jgi:hypothetical protein
MQTVKRFVGRGLGDVGGDGQWHGAHGTAYLHAYPAPSARELTGFHSFG